MSKQSPANQSKLNKLRLFSLLVFVVVMILALLAWQYAGQNTLPNTTSTNDAALFVGLRNVPPQEVHAALPALENKPSVVYFTSKFCLECKKLTPTLEALLKDYPQIHYKKFDILEDKKRFAKVFSTFKPVTVPTIVLISPAGKIQNVLYNEQPRQKVQTALDQLTQSPPR